jgi:hypothetical protein
MISITQFEQHHGRSTLKMLKDHHMSNKSIQSDAGRRPRG